jgi:hypothetical protein
MCADAAEFFWHLDSTNFQAIWLHPLPFSVRIAQRGVHPADWYAYDLYYCGVGPFASAQALLAANVSRCTYQPDATTEGRRGAWDVPGPDQLHQIRPSLLAPEPPAPAYYSLAGASGGNGRLVTWQGWSFFVTLRPSTGLAAMDVRFKGVRVAYELALSEAAALYSGTGADQARRLGPTRGAHTPANTATDHTTAQRATPNHHHNTTTTPCTTPHQHQHQGTAHGSITALSCCRSSTSTLHTR